MSTEMKHIEHSETFAELAAAMVVAQSQIEGAKKDATNPHFKSRYADLSSVMDACKGPLNANGISIIQAPVPCEGNKIAVETMLIHKSGQWIRGRAEVPMAKIDPQGYGSAMTYARRYSLAAMAGVCPEDDDGEAATGRPPQRQQQRPAQQARQPAPQHDAAEPPALVSEADTIRLEELVSCAADPDKTTTAILGKEKVTSFGMLTQERAEFYIGSLTAAMNKKNKQAATAAGK